MAKHRRPDRQKHDRADLEAILLEVEAHGWRVERDRGYFKTYCPCVDKHMKTVKLTPSDPRYPLNLRKWFQRQTCWKEMT